MADYNAVNPCNASILGESDTYEWCNPGNVNGYFVYECQIV